MKRIFPLICLAMANITHAQINEPSAKKLTDKELGLQYLNSSKNLKIAGWSLLGAGLILSTIGIGKAENNLYDENAGEALTLIGSLLTIASVPCFITGAKNKGRAEIMLRNENTMVLNRPNTVRSYPALSLAIKL